MVILYTLAGNSYIDIKDSAIFDDLEAKEKVWMSHGDQVVKLAPGFKCIASTTTCPNAASENSEKKMMKEVRRHGVKCVKYGTSDELSAAAGESGRTVFALCDRGFAEVILREIDREAE